LFSHAKKAPFGAFLACRRALQQFEAQIHTIPLILGDAKIPSRDFKAGMVENVHQHHGEHPGLPRVVAEGFAQAVASDAAAAPMAEAASLMIRHA